MENLSIAITTIIVALLAGNGIIVTLITRHYSKHDRTKKLCEVNNRQGEELVMLSNISEMLITSEEQLVDALHAKNVLNGNSAEIKRNLANARKELREYTKSKKDKGLFI